jgi:hypothetical protein
VTSELIVVGGAYVEICAYPRSSIYRGSGVRAASILAGLGNRVTLHTALDDQLAGVFKDIATRLRFSLVSAPRAREIQFRYRHPLDVPDVDADLSVATTHQDVSAGAALVFGMLEGRPVVRAGRVVYDPQDGDKSQPFGANGSSADRLAVVASLSEARVLSGEEAPDAAAMRLIERGAEVAVVKCGILGAYVQHRGQGSWVRAFPTDYVWKIGSGDVFSAAFAHAWITESRSPLEAAWFASRSVAEYVRNRKELVDADTLALIRAEASGQVQVRTPPSLIDKPVYLAGPFFNTAQQWLVDEARAALKALGLRVISPIHDIGEGPAEQVAPEDLRAIRESGLVFALLDGIDAGTLFEIGYARALDIPVVAVGEAVDERSLTMLIGSNCIVHSDFCSALYAAGWQLLVDN